MLNAFRPGELWLDTDGNRIRAHSAGIFYDDAASSWWWYGADAYRKGAANRVINVYSSTDLYNWRFRGVAFEFKCWRAGAKACYADRPKVVRNRAGRLVMWIKATPFVAVAVAATPLGPFSFVAQWYPNGEPMGDPTAFIDPVTGDGWWIYSVRPDPSRRRVVRLCKMTQDLTNLTGIATTISQGLEAPAVFYDPAVRRYFLWFSHCSGWAPNAAAAFSAPSLLATSWRPEGNPTRSATTFDSQSTFVLPLATREGTRFIYIADRFKAQMETDPESGRYVWLPIEVSREGHLSVAWRATWTLDALGTLLRPPAPPSSPPPPRSPPPPPSPTTPPMAPPLPWNLKARGVGEVGFELSAVSIPSRRWLGELGRELC